MLGLCLGVRGGWSTLSGCSFCLRLKPLSVGQCWGTGIEVEADLEIAFKFSYLLGSGGGVALRSFNLRANRLLVHICIVSFFDILSILVYAILGAMFK